MTFAVEIYDSDARIRTVLADARIESAARELEGQGRSIRYLGSMAIPGDEMVFCLFAADSQDPVDELLRRLGIVAERIVEAVASDFTDRRTHDNTEA
jgi:muconolactone delta-isomerase